MKEIFKRIAYSSIRNKIIVMMIFVIIVAMLIFFALVNAIVSQNYKTAALHSATFAFSLGKELIIQQTWPMLYISDMLANNQDIKSIIEKYEKAIPATDEQYRDMIALTNILQTTDLSYKSIYAKLYMDADWVYVDKSVYFGDINSFEEKHTNFNKSKSRNIWTQPENLVLTLNEPQLSVVSVLRKIISSNDYTQIIGIVRVSMESIYFDEIINQVDITKDGLVMLVNSKFEVISTSNEAKLKKINSQSSEIFPLLTKEEYDWCDLQLGSESYFVKTEIVNGTDWYMISLIPMDEINEPAEKVFLIMIFTMFCILIFAVFGSYIISNRFFARIRHLCDHMTGVRLGKIKSIELKNDSFEIDMLYGSFNYMTDEIKELMRKQYLDGLAVKNAEIRALQEQINPHFLYNTLDLINWRAMHSNAPDIAEIAQTLAKYYKLSLSSGRNIVTIKEELAHVEIYVRIQNFRFKNRIHLELKMNNEIKQYAITKIVLQPLVENSILHGIMANNREISGEIKIEAYKENEVIVIAVSDNGIGMSVSQINQLITEREPAKGYGVYNINQRLKLLYGSEFGLRYASSAKHGTTVYVRIPAEIYDGKNK